MVDDVKDILETTEIKGSADGVERARIARERREVEQRRRLDELRAHAAAAQAQREKRDEDRRRRQEEQKAKDTDRRSQVEERKKAIWEASISRREALLQREKDREERLERARVARSSPRSAFAFGSSTPRLLEPADSSGFFWAARRILAAVLGADLMINKQNDNIEFSYQDRVPKLEIPVSVYGLADVIASSTSNVMFASAPLTRRASAMHLDMSDGDNKDEIDRQPAPAMWSSVARRRTDLVPTPPAPRAPGRAYSMTRLDRLPHHTQLRSGDTTPGSRPGSALSSAPPPVPTVTRRPNTARRPRPASIAGTGVNTPRGEGAISTVTTPSVSRDGSCSMLRSTPRPRPLSVHVAQPHHVLTPGDGKPPLHRKPKLSKEIDKSPRPSAKARSVSPGISLTSSHTTKESSVDKDIHKVSSTVKEQKAQVNATEVTQKLEALKIHNDVNVNVETKVNENNKETLKQPEVVQPTPEIPVPESPAVVEVLKQEPVVKAQESVVKPQEPVVKPQEPVVKPQETAVKPQETEKKEERVKETHNGDVKELTPEKPEENEMTASMNRRITTEEQAKAALAERRRRAREELERNAELERLRLQREAEEELERQRLEEERQRREEDEARELAALQRSMEEEKLRKAIEAQQQLEKEEADRKAREEIERQARLKEEEEKRKAAELAEVLRKEEADKEEKERLARKQRVEAIMARTRNKKTEEEKKQENKAPNSQSTNAGDVSEPSNLVVAAENNGNVSTGDLLGLDNDQEKAETQEVPKSNSAPEPTNGNISHLGHLSANFIQAEIQNEHKDMPKLEENDFTTHNGHNNHNSHPLTLQNAI